MVGQHARKDQQSSSRKCTSKSGVLITKSAAINLYQYWTMAPISWYSNEYPIRFQNIFRVCRTTSWLILPGIYRKCVCFFSWSYCWWSMATVWDESPPMGSCEVCSVFWLTGLIPWDRVRPISSPQHRGMKHAEAINLLKVHTCGCRCNRNPLHEASYWYLCAYVSGSCIFTSVTFI